MPSSTEVLASPPQKRRPVLRAVVAALCLALLGWGVAQRLSEDDPQQQPAAAPPPSATPEAPGSSGTSGTSAYVAVGPPLWVRYPTPLEGRWVAGGRSGPLTLMIRNAYIYSWQGVGQRQGRPLDRSVMLVEGHRVRVWPEGARARVATYAWRIDGRRLTFRLVEESRTARPELAGLTFRRAA